jgi:hypothetical protein
MERHVQSPRCLLCDAPVVDDEDLREHLASVHDLRDDPGTQSQVADLQSRYLDRLAESGERAAPGPALGGLPVPPASHVHDPRVDDERWRPVTIGIGGLLVLVLAAVALELAL